MRLSFIYNNYSWWVINPTDQGEITEIYLELNKPKLRIFNVFKDFENQPSYLIKPLNYFHRRAIATMMVGSFRIRAETQRYFRPKISYERQFCITCHNENQEVECQTHYLFSCSAYNNLRHTWLNKLEKNRKL